MARAKKPPQTSVTVSKNVTVKPKKGKVFLSPDAAKRAAEVREQNVKAAKPATKKEKKVNKKALKAATKEDKKYSKTKADARAEAGRRALQKTPSKRSVAEKMSLQRNWTTGRIGAGGLGGGSLRNWLTK